MNSDFPSAEEYASEKARFGALDVLDIQALQRGATAPYSNQVMLDFNGNCMRMAVFKGDYRWHMHPSSDEIFLVVEGELHIEFDAAPERVLRPWQAITVPAGTVHRTRAVGRTVNLTFEQQAAETVFVGPPAGG